MYTTTLVNNILQTEVLYHKAEQFGSVQGGPLVLFILGFIIIIGKRNLVRFHVASYLEMWESYIYELKSDKLKSFAWLYHHRKAVCLEKLGI